MGSDERWKQIFAEKKKRQLNDGPCAAVIVDCDCDWCLSKETDRELARAAPAREITMGSVTRYDARLATDVCGNKDVIMRESHDGLFVLHSDYAALRQLAEQLTEALQEELVKQACTCKFLGYFDKEPPCDTCKLAALLTSSDALLGTKAKETPGS